MYCIKKTIKISAAHRLSLPYTSKCSHIHGHNWIITVYLKSMNLDKTGMVYDFSKIKENLYLQLDHNNLNDFLPQPTAENIAKYVCDILGEKCFKVSVQESEGNIATYEKENT